MANRRVAPLAAMVPLATSPAYILTPACPFTITLPSQLPPGCTIKIIDPVSGKILAERIGAVRHLLATPDN